MIPTLALDVQLLAADGEGLRERAQEPLAQLAGGARVREAGLDDRELVAAEARHRVDVPGARPQPAGHQAQKLVAAMVPERVVDVLELVEVEEQEGHQLVVPASLDERLLQPVLEQGAVGQVRQGIVVREVPDLLLGAQAVGDVPLDRDVVADLARDVANRGDRRFLVVELAVLAARGEIAVPHLAALDHVLHGPVVGLVARVAQQQGERGLADGLLARVARDALEGGIDVAEAAGRVGDLDRVAGVLDGRGQQGVAALRLLLRRDVERDGHHVRHAAARIAQRHLGRQPGPLPVCLAEPKLLEQRHRLAGLDDAAVERVEAAGVVLRVVRGAALLLGRVAVSEHRSAVAVPGADPRRHRVDHRLELGAGGGLGRLGGVGELEAAARAPEGPEQQNDQDGRADGDAGDAPQHLPVDLADLLALGRRDLLVLQHRVGHDLVQRDLERLQGRVDGPVGRRVAPPEGDDGRLELLERVAQALDRLGCALDGADVVRLAALEQEREATAEDVEPGRELLRLLGVVEGVPLELVDEAEILDLGLRRHPQVRHELAGDQLVLTNDVVRADQDCRREEQQGGCQCSVLRREHGGYSTCSSRSCHTHFLSVRESCSSRF